MTNNEDTLNFFENLTQRLERADIGFEDDGLQKNKIELAQTDEEAVIIALKNKQAVKKEEVPKDADNKIIDSLINDKINKLINGD